MPIAACRRHAFIEGMPVKSIRKVIRSSMLGLLAVLWLCTGRVVWAASMPRSSTVLRKLQPCAIWRQDSGFLYRQVPGRVWKYWQLTLLYVEGLAVFFFDEKAIESARTDGDSNDEWHEPNQQPY